MKKKKIIILSVIAFAVLGGGWYAYHEYTRKVKDLSRVKAEVRMEPQQLISEFEKNETVANTNYLDKIIAIKGVIKAIERSDRGHYSVILGDPASLSSVRCSMDSLHQHDITMIPEGSVVTVKGACTGFNADELLGSDVILNRCVLEK